MSREKFDVGERVRINLSGHHTYGCVGTITRVPIDPALSYCWVVLDGEQGPRAYHPIHMSKIDGAVNPSAFETATGALR